MGTLPLSGNPRPDLNEYGSEGGGEFRGGEAIPSPTPPRCYPLLILCEEGLFYPIIF